MTAATATPDTEQNPTCSRCGDRLTGLIRSYALATGKPMLCYACGGRNPSEEEMRQYSKRVRGKGNG
jgi:hypothetical protein